MKMLTAIRIEGDEILVPGELGRYGLGRASISGNVVDLLLIDRNAHRIPAEVHLATVAEAQQVFSDLRLAA